MGVTGARDTVASMAPALVERCRRHTDIAIGVGLGVRSADQAAEVSSFADGVIVGSAFVTAAEQGGTAGARAFAAELAGGVRRAPAAAGAPRTPR
jgi:tryptophan synthase alpha chain